MLEEQQKNVNVDNWEILKKIRHQILKTHKPTNESVKNTQITLQNNLFINIRAQNQILNTWKQLEFPTVSRAHIACPEDNFETKPGSYSCQYLFLTSKMRTDVARGSHVTHLVARVAGEMTPPNGKIRWKFRGKIHRS